MELNLVDQVGFSPLGPPKAIMYFVLERKRLITCFSESFCKLCVSLCMYPVFRDLSDVHNAQERQKTDPGEAERLPNACVDFINATSQTLQYLTVISKEKLFFFFKHTSPASVCQCFYNVWGFLFAASIEECSYVVSVICLCCTVMILIEKAELNSDYFADYGKSPTIVRGHRDQSAVLTIILCFRASKVKLSVKIRANSSKKEELDKKNHRISL